MSDKDINNQVIKSEAIIEMVHEHVKHNDEYPEGTTEKQMTTLLEQMDAVIYAAEKLKEINPFITDEYVQEVKDFYENK